MSEFKIIRDYFATQIAHRSDVTLGIGDDAAIVKPPEDHEVVITTDTLISGVHFPTTTLAYDIGHKSLAVNLSDLAAMGASPAWVTLAITLPEENHDWLREFCQGFFALANRYDIQLIGGDLTRGPSLSLTVQAFGFVPKNEAILRSQANPTDLIYVTGTLGDAGLALRHLTEKITLTSKDEDYLLGRLNRPEPRITAGEQLRLLASAGIDISDGLALDLGHILEQSKVGAKVNVNQLPFSSALLNSLSKEEGIELALTAGDDYELCFTIPEKNHDLFEKKLSLLACPITCIGEITADKKLELFYQDGKPYDGSILGYQHF